MNTESNYDTFNQSSVAGSAQSLLDKGTEAYGRAGQAVSEAYDKSSQKVKETYERARSYTAENPGKTILIALGIGVGIGLLLRGSSSHQSRTGRIAKPVLNAISDVANEFFR